MSRSTVHLVLRCLVPVLATLAFGQAPAVDLNLEVVTNHRGLDPLNQEFRDNDSETATPIQPNEIVYASSIGEQYSVRSSADWFGNSAVDMQINRTFGPEWVDLAIVRADAIHTNVFGYAARAKFSFFLPIIDVAADAANVDLLYGIEITKDFHDVWVHQGVMNFDLSGTPDWHWNGEDIGAPDPGAIRSVHIEGAFATADLGIIGPGDSFRLGVEKYIQLEKMPNGGFLEGAFMAIGDPDDLSFSPFGVVTFEPLSSVPEPAPLGLSLLGVAGALAARRRAGARR